MELSNASEATIQARERQRESREAVLARQALEKAKFWSDLEEQSDKLKQNISEAVAINSAEGLDFAAVLHEVRLPADTYDGTSFSMVTEITDALTNYVKADAEARGINVRLARETTTGTEEDPDDYYKSVFSLTWPS